jgi:hypothetical protein
MSNIAPTNVGFAVDRFDAHLSSSSESPVRGPLPKSGVADYLAESWRPQTDNPGAADPSPPSMPGSNPRLAQACSKP